MRGLKTIKPLIPLLVALFILSFFSMPIKKGTGYIRSPKTDGHGHFSFSIFIKDVDWTDKSASVEIFAGIESYPYNYSQISCRCVNEMTYVSGDRPRTIRGGLERFYLNQTHHWSREGEDYFHFDGQVDTKFRLFGLSEFYPYDSYLLNLTFEMPEFLQLANETNTDVAVYCWMPDWQLRDDSPKIAHRNGILNLIVSRVMYREKWVTLPFEWIIFCSFLLLGASLFLSPKEIQHRLVVYLTLFVFTMTLFNTVGPIIPTRTYWLSLTEFYILFIVSGTSLFSIFSIIEYGLIKKTFPEDIAGFFEVFPLSLIIVLISGTFDSFKTMSGAYPWISITDTPFYHILIALSFGFLSRITIEFSKTKTWKKIKNGFHSRLKKLKKRFNRVISSRRG